VKKIDYGEDGYYYCGYGVKRSWKHRNEVRKYYPENNRYDDE